MRRIPAVFLLAIVALLTLAAPAWAHTELAATAPAPGSGVPDAPGAVSLTFTQRVDPRLATVTVRSADGGVVSLGQPRAAGLDLVQPLQNVAAGRYEVQWRAAAADGHVLRGTYDFRVGTKASAAAGGAERLSPADMLRQHGKGNYNHKGMPSYAISAADRRKSAKDADAADAAAPAVAASAPVPAPDNAGATIVTLLAAALGVTTVTAVVESVRAHRV